MKHIVPPALVSINSDDYNYQLKLMPFWRCYKMITLRSKYLEWLNNISNLKLIASSELMSPNKSIDFIESSFQRFNNPFSQGFFIYSSRYKEFIGTAKLDNYSPKDRTAWDGILIGNQTYKGKGIGTIVYNLLLQYCFVHQNIAKVYGGCNENNKAMVRIFANLGYTFNSRVTNVDFIDQKHSDHLYFSISKYQYRRNILYRAVPIYDK